MVIYLDVGRYVGLRQAHANQDERGEQRSHREDYRESRKERRTERRMSLWENSQRGEEFKGRAFCR